ncbi:MAG: glycosyltransferase [wastewater metagenome]|nr:glycosyltransferase [Candidatus Loosdrechtia aerotolerans]
MHHLLHYLNLNVIGGVETLFAELMQERWMAETVRHHVIAGTNIHPDLLPAIHQGTESIEYIKHLSSGVYIPRWLRGLRLLRCKSISRRLKPHAVLVWNALDRRESLATATHVDGPLIYMEHGAAWDANRNRAAVFLKGVRRVICNSHASRRVIQERLGYTGSSVVCHNPLRPSIRAENVRPRTLPYTQPLRLGAAGRLIPLKGFILLPHVIAELLKQGIDCELVLAGTGPEREAILNTAARLGIEERVTMPGIIKDMGTFYQRVDIVIVPSIREPFGLVSIEAAAHGCPVIVSAVDGLPETLLHGKTGFALPPTEPIALLTRFGSGDYGIPDMVYDPHEDRLTRPKFLSPKAISTTIIDLIGNGSYAHLSANALKDVKERFSFAKYQEKAYSLVTELFQ